MDRRGSRPIVADIMTKQGSRKEVLDEIMIGSLFRNVMDNNNYVIYKGGEIKVENLTTKSKEMDQEDRSHRLVGVEEDTLKPYDK